MPTITVQTPVGTARATVTVGAGTGLVVLGHGAGGGIEAPDLVAVTTTLHAAGWTVARVEQPYRVQGRRAPDRAPKLDAAWVSTCAELRAKHGGPLVVGGRSSGARVACRTALQTGCAAVVCLAFPLRPPRRPEASRAAELEQVQVPLLVVQGDSDPFGVPADFPAGPHVVGVPGNHALRRGALVAEVVAEWVAVQRLA